jgi:hypothetical protein
MNMTALPYYQDGKRILFAGAENFGPGSFDSASRMHTFRLQGGCILPCKVISIAKDEVSSKVDNSMMLNGIVIKIFEN